MLKYQGDLDGARSRLADAYRAATEEGDEASLTYVVGHLPQLELWSGDWPEAERRAVEHLELADATGQADQRRQALFNLALVHAHVGRVEEARAEAGELLDDAEAADDPWGASNALAVLGFVELSLGDARAAAAPLARNVEIREAMGMTDPRRAQVDYVEALVETGEVGRAAVVARLLGERAGSTPGLALAEDARAAVAAAQGDLDAAAAAAEEALAQHERAGIDFDVARTLLVLGRIRRRRGERRAARDALERARAIFERLDAPLWAARAAAELRRVPIRRRGPDDELTPTEERVAELAASGRTNAEVAQALFVSPKTVEANLTRVYRKLGVRSRAELGATMALRKGSKT
jgi:DNA-binding CsgD family transcriptional regulator